MAQPIGNHGLLLVWLFDLGPLNQLITIFGQRFGMVNQPQEVMGWESFGVFRFDL